MAGICPSLQAITFSRYPFDDAVPADIRVMPVGTAEPSLGNR